MFKKFSIMFLSLILVFSVISTSTAFAADIQQDVPIDGGNSKYQTVKVSSTKTVRTHPEAFPSDIALALVGLGGAYSLFQIPKTLNKFLAWAGLSSTIVSHTSTTTYEVTMYTYFLKTPTSTSAGYYKYKIKNNITGKTEYTKAYNIGKNGM